mgnify:CR=1 FL=1
MKKRNLFVTLSLTFLTTIIGMSVFEALKQSWRQDITIWESHVYTTIFISVLAALGAYFILARRELLANRIKVETANRQRVEEALKESEEKFRFLAASAHDAIIMIDHEGNVIFWNNAAEKMFGYTNQEAMGKNCHGLIAPSRYHEAYEEGFGAFKESGQGAVIGKTLELEARKKDGAEFPVELSLSGLLFQGKWSAVGIIRDITERKRLEDEITEISLRDQLTELYNRRGFITLAEQQMKVANRTNRQMWLTFIDCDNLKWINDTLGHEEGDKSLIATGNILRQTFRESDIIARMGGDEFAILSAEAVDMNPEAFLKRLQQNIDSYNAKESRPYKLGISWGTAVYDPESPLSLDRLISSADELMYAQKRTKTNGKIKKG